MTAADQYDDAYKAHVMRATMQALFDAAVDQDSSTVTVRATEAMDALLEVIAFVAVSTEGLETPAAIRRHVEEVAKSYKGAVRAAVVYQREHGAPIGAVRAGQTQ